ncbi:MAG: threonylcarbamoyl-AMP synthase [Alphaproteobacteria bacterium]|nr:threonylcarbamoyl-AMP synthase [Alphaproteobacteria bacterium]
MPIFDATDENILKAAHLIQQGEIVAFPTETVYGLGADAYNPTAVAKIFEAKNRPTFNPLISHIADVDFLKDYAETDARVKALAKKFWPGPLTMVLKRKQFVESLDLACAGLPTVSVRMPNHPVALELIRKSATPIVAPSANRSQSISPTTAEHVQHSLGDRVPMILDGGSCGVGVESTIIDLTSKDIVLLRAGGIPMEEISEFLNEPVLISGGNPNLPSSPGQMLKHYAPKYETRINVITPADDEFMIGFGDIDGHLNLSKAGDLREATANLFAYMHKAEEQTKYTKIAIAPIPMEGLGRAINDRIKRASYKD